VPGLSEGSPTLNPSPPVFAPAGDWNAKSGAQPESNEVHCKLKAYGSMKVPASLVTMSAVTPPGQIVAERLDPVMVPATMLAPAGGGRAELGIGLQLAGTEEDASAAPPAGTEEDASAAPSDFN